MQIAKLKLFWTEIPLNQDWTEFTINKNDKIFNLTFWKRYIVYSFLQCRNLSSYLYSLEALPSLRPILWETSALTAFSQTMSLIKRGLLNKDKSISSSRTSGPKSCVIKTISYVGKNIYHNYPAKSMIPSVGSKNIQNCHAMSMTPNAGENFFQLFHATSKIHNAGRNFQSTLKNKPLTEPLKDSRTTEGSPMKEQENSKTSSMKQRTMLEERPNKQGKLQERPPKKSEIRPNKPKIEQLHL